MELFEFHIKRYLLNGINLFKLDAIIKEHIINKTKLLNKKVLLNDFEHIYEILTMQQV